MFESILKFFKKKEKKENKTNNNSKNAAKERLHLVLMQDRANVSADFLELMKQEIIDVIKKYIDVDESAIDVRLTNKENEDGTNGAPALYANIPIINIKNEARKIEKQQIENKETKKEEKSEEKNEKDSEKSKKEKETKKEEIEEVIEEAKIIIDEGNMENKEEQQKEKQEENNKKEDKKEAIPTEEEIKSEK